MAHDVKTEAVEKSLDYAAKTLKDTSRRILRNSAAGALAMFFVGLTLWLVNDRNSTAIIGISYLAILVIFLVLLVTLEHRIFKTRAGAATAIFVWGFDFDTDRVIPVRILEKVHADYGFGADSGVLIRLGGPDKHEILILKIQDAMDASEYKEHDVWFEFKDGIPAFYNSSTGSGYIAVPMNKRARELPKHIFGVKVTDAIKLAKF